jgi:L-fuconolactonase
VEKRLENYSRNPLFKGVRHIVQSEPDDFMLHADFQRGISSLRTFGLTYDILVYPQQLPATIKLLDKFSDQPFVIDHIAKPEIAGKKIGPWGRHMREIALAKNVYCKLSGMVTEADWESWKSTDFYPYMDVIFDAFGTDRILFGSDWPVCTLAGSYRQILEIVEEYCSQFDETARAGIFGENAIKFYNLKV